MTRETFMKRAFIAALAGLSLSAQAVEYNRIDTGKSTLQFVFRQMNVPVEGHFKRFKSQLSFDPAKPAAARAELDIELASVDTGSPEADDEVAGKLWFDSKTHPTARFVATAIKPLGNNRYEIAGQMSIKGRSRAVSAPASLRADGNAAVIDGAFVLKRADFGIGEGIWADFGTVANEVQIKFRLVAMTAKP
jgi:polyisoprenoid-binding protein YceI